PASSVRTDFTYNPFSSDSQLLLLGFYFKNKKTQESKLLSRVVYLWYITQLSNFNYSMIVATRPEPTVRPPSRFFGTLHLLFSVIFQ
ncbi:MAG: hypothetical protein Q4D29_10335, partial [Lachnospiraceae bacterium]|nr:hypothetical protein [Lachnospiraceae bacterium]